MIMRLGIELILDSTGYMISDWFHATFRAFFIFHLIVTKLESEKGNIMFSSRDKLWLV